MHTQLTYNRQASKSGADLVQQILAWSSPSQLPPPQGWRLVPKPISLPDFTWHDRLIDTQPASYAFSKASNVVLINHRSQFP